MIIRAQPRDDTYTTETVVQQLSQEQLQMADNIQEIKNQLEQTAFSRKICETIKESDSLKECIRKLVWKTIREKTWALLLAGLIFVILLFIKEVSTYVVQFTARKTAEEIIDQRLPPTTTGAQSSSMNSR